ncbi:MAG: hypothetical protein WCJ35_20750 [Planctomycetota bacterium]
MQAVKATIKNGNVTLEQPVDIKGPVEAIVIVLDPDPWNVLVCDPRPRPALLKASNEALEEFLSGQTTLLDPDNLT